MFSVARCGKCICVWSESQLICFLNAGFEHVGVYEYACFLRMCVTAYGVYVRVHCACACDVGAHAGHTVEHQHGVLGCTDTWREKSISAERQSILPCECGC